MFWLSTMTILLLWLFFFFILFFWCLFWLFSFFMSNNSINFLLQAMNISLLEWWQFWMVGYILMFFDIIEETIDLTQPPCRFLFPPKCSILLFGCQKWAVILFIFILNQWKLTISFHWWFHFDTTGIKLRYYIFLGWQPCLVLKFICRTIFYTGIV